jgi:hypothetical protein
MRRTRKPKQDAPLDALTRAAVLNLLHTLLHEPGSATAITMKQEPILSRIVPAFQFAPISACLEFCLANRTAPTMDELRTHVIQLYGPSTNRVTDFLREYEAIAPTLPVLAAEAAIEAIVAALTWSPANPDGPIRRRAYGTYLDGSYADPERNADGAPPSPRPLLCRRRRLRLHLVRAAPLAHRRRSCISPRSSP